MVSWKLITYSFQSSNIISFSFVLNILNKNQKRISRNNDCKSTNVHFFTSHFFTALTEGPETVSSWTAKKNINIFDMKFIFIPINEQLHWSLCVVVNCDKISRVKDEPSDKDEIPCLLFFDSLKAHRKKKIASYIRKWIAFEADRLQLSLDSDCLSQETMPIVAPHSKYSVRALFIPICHFPDNFFFPFFA